MKLYNVVLDKSTIHTLLKDRNNNYVLPLYSLKRLSLRAVDSNNRAYSIIV